MQQWKVLMEEPRHLHSYPNSSTSEFYGAGELIMSFGSSVSSSVNGGSTCNYTYFTRLSPGFNSCKILRMVSDTWWTLNTQFSGREEPRRWAWRWEQRKVGRWLIQLSKAAERVPSRSYPALPAASGESSVRKALSAELNWSRKKQTKP